MFLISPATYEQFKIAKDSRHILKQYRLCSMSYFMLLPLGLSSYLIVVAGAFWSARNDTDGVDHRNKAVSGKPHSAFSFSYPMKDSEPHLI
jgi:hypothetical protein